MDKRGEIMRIVIAVLFGLISAAVGIWFSFSIPVWGR